MLLSTLDSVILRFIFSSLQIVATAVFMLIICVVGDKRYTKIPAQLQPFYIGFAMLAIGVSYGTNAGYGLNPARDLAPRLVTFVAGWGQGVFR